MLGTWSKAQFKAKLQEGECLVTWMKSPQGRVGPLSEDNTRSKHYTLKADLIPDLPNKRGRISNPPQLTPQHTAVFDVRKDRWDGVKVSRVLTVELVEE